jgi:hypothetical protein
LGDKISLRLNNIPVKDPLNVLDAFHGAGCIWKNVQKKYAGKINIVRIDKEQKDDAFVLIGDNSKYLNSLDLSKFDVVDLDAYGVPFDQLEILFKRKFKGVVFVTFVRAVFGKLPKGILNALGYTSAMVDKVPTLFDKNGFQKMLAYLSVNGVTQIKYRAKEPRKYYLCFTLG